MEKIQFPISFKYPYLGATRRGEGNFSVEITNTPLVDLIDAALLGSRVYELMTIARPGDCLHYLQVKICDLDDEVIKRVKDNLKSNNWLFKTDQPLRQVAFTDFDACFWMLEDNHVYEVYWRESIDEFEPSSHRWKVHLNSLFAEVLAAQQMLRATDDFLIQHEIKLIDARKHCNDQLALIPRLRDFDTNLLAHKPENQAFYRFLETLIAKPEIKSVSCPFNDFYLWRILVKEQVKRSIDTQLAPQETFYLCGKEVGFGDATSPTNWGGYAHTPYEGMACADCVFLPEWRKFFFEYAGNKGSLARATRLECNYLFSARDLGELGCADRTMVGNWFFYQNKH